MEKTKWLWLVFGALVVGRLVFAHALGYLHPDEHFQGPEIAFGRRGVASWVPWEFADPERLYRTSWLPEVLTTWPWAFVGMVLRPVKWILVRSFGKMRWLGWLVDGIEGEGAFGGGMRGAWVRVMAPRLGLWMFSLLGDAGVQFSAHLLSSPLSSKLSPNSLILSAFQSPPHTCTILYALSWPVLGIGARPLSNVLEQIIASVAFSFSFALFRSLALLRQRSAERKEFGGEEEGEEYGIGGLEGEGGGGKERGKVPRVGVGVWSVMLGVVVGIGVMVRFTFVAWMWPVVLALLWSEMERWNWRLVKVVLGGGLGVVLGLGGGVIWDGAMRGCDVWGGEWECVGRIGIVENILYNLNPDNTALHGTHPHYLHLFLHLPLLAGPFLLLHLLSPLSTMLPLQSKPSLHHVPIVIIFLSIATLSISHHQELRFLFPLVPLLPLTLLPSTSFSPSPKPSFFSTTLFRPKPLFILHTLFHLSLALFFGMSHQSGVLRSSLDLSELIHNPASPTTTPTCAIFFNTYTTPRFTFGLTLSPTSSPNPFSSSSIPAPHPLLATQAYISSNQIPVTIIDIPSSNHTLLHTAFSLCQPHSSIYLSTPFTSTPQHHHHTPPPYTLRTLTTYFPSFSGETPPPTSPFYKNWKLFFTHVLYEVNLKP